LAELTRKIKELDREYAESLFEEESDVNLCFENYGLGLNQRNIPYLLIE